MIYFKNIILDINTLFKFKIDFCKSKILITYKQLLITMVFNYFFIFIY